MPTLKRRSVQLDRKSIWDIATRIEELLEHEITEPIEQQAGQKEQRELLMNIAERKRESCWSITLAPRKTMILQSRDTLLLVRHFLPKRLASHCPQRPLR